ncbi:MAG: response regulator transcription factor [Sphingobacteriia bacterium]|jgi:DNA-binding NarL/FixJ family response regulator
MQSNLLIAFAEDHVGVRNAFITMIKDQSPNSNFFAVGNNGKELLESIKQSNKIPDIAILDLSMPIMDGTATAKEILALYPTTKVLILSFVVDDNTIMNLFNLGIHGYLVKTDSKLNFESVFSELMVTGYLKNQYFRKQKTEDLNWDKYAFIGNVKFNHAEMKFLKLKITNLTLNEIAKEMCVAPKTVENYRDAVYEKLNVGSRHELVLKLKEMGIEA